MKSVADAVLALAAPATVDFSEVVYESKLSRIRSSRMRTSQASYSRRTSRRPLRRPSKNGHDFGNGTERHQLRIERFDSCASLVSVTVEEGCDRNRQLHVPEHQTDLRNPAQFRHEDQRQRVSTSCSALTTINLRQGVKTIENYAFQNCGTDRDHPPGCHGNTRAECLRRLGPKLA